MNFIQVGAMNYIWNNIKKAVVNNDKDNEQKILMKKVTAIEIDLAQLKHLITENEKYKKMLALTITDETTKLLEDDILTINNKEGKTVCFKIE